MRTTPAGALICLDFLFLSLLVIQGQEPAKRKYIKVDTRKPASNAKDDPRKLVEDSKVGIGVFEQFEQDAAKGVLSAKSNGVELAIKLKAVPDKEFTDSEVASAPRRHTFSIVAYSSQKEWGVGVASRVLAVGAGTPWARAGAGAITTQVAANVTYGPRGLALLGMWPLEGSSTTPSTTPWGEGKQPSPR